MAITFAWRSDTSTVSARYGENIDGHATNAMSYMSLAGALGGSVYQADNTIGALSFSAYKNFGDASGGAFSILVRYAPTFVSVPASEVALLNFGLGVSEINGACAIFQRTSGQIINRLYKDNAALLVNTGPTWTSTANVFYDYLITGHGDDASGRYNIIMNGVTQSGSNLLNWLPGFDMKTLKSINLGGLATARKCQYSFNELVIWNEIIDPTNITLVHAGTGVTSTAQTLNGSSRTGWVDVAPVEKSDWTSLTAAQIVSGNDQIQAGLTQSGSAVAETWSTITADQIKSGVEQIQNSSTITGTYLWNTIAASDIKSGVETIQNSATITGTYLWSSLAASNILNGVNQIQDSITITGSLVAPAAAAGTATALDIPNIKEQVRWILDTNNTTTSSVLNLSASMSKQVQVVQKVNPQKLSTQATLFPAVTVFTKSKSMKSATIARNQVNGKREAKLTLTVVGMVWNQNFSADINSDPADQDLEYLMENIERILRSYHDLGSNVTWQIPTDVVYHTAAFDEQSHFRVGFLDIEITVFY